MFFGTFLLTISLVVMSNSHEEILQLSATSLIKKLSEGHITAEEVMITTLDRVEKVNPKYNAIHSLRDRAELLTEARRCDRQSRRGKLCGIPIAIKICRM